MVELVERMLDLHKQLPRAKTPRAWADSLRPTASGHRVSDCRFAGAASREPEAGSGAAVTRFDDGGKGRQNARWRRFK
jgi:hypothetical protein